MTLFNIKEIKKADYYVDVAFRRAVKKASLLRNKKIKGEPLVIIRRIEVTKINVVKDILDYELSKILTNFPDLEKESKFYKELIRCFVDYRMLKKSLGSVKWARENIDKISSLTLNRMKMTRVLADVHATKKSYYGRVASILKQINKNLEFLETARKIFKNFPIVKEMPTVCIVGFPNVGKTTLLFKLTGSKAKISAYPFTTLGINVGYKEIKFEKVQFLDTPGTLNRFGKMNVFEKQAHIALEHLANIIVYVFDLTEPYSLEEQMKLYEETLKHKKPTIIYLSKTDIVPQKKIDSFRLTHNFVSNEEDLERAIARRNNLFLVFHYYCCDWERDFYSCIC